MAEAAAAAGLFALFVGIGIYVFGSFLLMGRHVGARKFGLSFRELLRELWIAVLTQPILPLFYLFGRRLARGKPGGVPIVFVHGYMQNRVGFLGLVRALARKGLGPMFGFNYPWFASIASNAQRLERFLEAVCKETGSGAVDLVCHSMGGLIAMELMANEARQETLKVRRCVTIATPHAGVMWRGPLLGFGATSLRRGSKLLEAHAGVKLKVPCLSVFSSHDNVVHPKESSSLVLRGGRDVEVEGLAHLAILFSPKVAEHVASFLAEPDPV
jgi:triacylglycerol lipase